MPNQQLDLDSSIDANDPLSLNIETLRDLDAADADAVRGGLGLVIGVGPIQSPSTLPVQSNVIGPSYRAG